MNSQTYGILLFIWSISNVVTEYQISNEYVPSFLEKRIPNVAEDIFPREMRMNISLTHYAGTLLYSIDSNGNQLILSLSNGFSYILSVEFRGKETLLYIDKICGCRLCKYIPLNIFLKIEDAVYVRCNNEKVQRIPFNQQKSINNAYPKGKFDKSSGVNSAYLWLVNMPAEGQVYHNPEQLKGCILSIEYNGKPLIMKKSGQSIGDKCEKKCSNKICPGVCYETYSLEPICDCTRTFGSGHMCEDVNKPINKRYNQPFQFKNFKLTWRSNAKKIFELGNLKMKITLTQEGHRLTFIQHYFGEADQRKELVMKLKSVDQHILIVTLGTTVELEVMENNLVMVTTAERDLGSEVFEYMILSSGRGVMDMVYRNDNGLEWKRWNLDESRSENVSYETEFMTFRPYVIPSSRRYTKVVTTPNTRNVRTYNYQMPNVAVVTEHWKRSGEGNELQEILRRQQLTFFILILLIVVIILLGWIMRQLRPKRKFHETFTEDKMSREVMDPTSPIIKK